MCIQFADLTTTNLPLARWILTAAHCDYEMGDAILFNRIFLDTEEPGQCWNGVLVFLHGCDFWCLIVLPGCCSGVVVVL
jgi:hypothetical protein